MLYVERKYGDTAKKVSSFHLGECFTALLVDKDPESVKSIQADGDELFFILNSCKGIRKTDQKVQWWFGDDAVFIAAFLSLKYSKEGSEKTVLIGL